VNKISIESEEHEKSPGILMYRKRDESPSPATPPPDRLGTYLCCFALAHGVAANENDGDKTSVALEQYIEDLCRDFSTMLSPEKSPELVVAVDRIEINLLSIPLGFIANELITNAAKYGNGRITSAGTGCALSVFNDGSPLPEGCDPAVRKGLGMTIIRSLVERIGGELRIGRGEKGQGTRFTILLR
jgi:two-component sensor histidine kinase